jgi:uncharacterized membrane protein YtjA (UPF0391 family)
MLRAALLCLLIALVAGGLGFYGVAGVAMGVAKFIFGLFLALFVIFLIAAFMVGRAIM